MSLSKNELLQLKKQGYNTNIVNAPKNKIQFGVSFYVISFITIIYALTTSWFLSTKDVLGMSIPTEIVVLNLLAIIIIYSLIIALKYCSLTFTDVFIFFCMSIMIVPVVFFIYIILKLKYGCPKPK